MQAKVRAKCDHECITHHMKKGREYLLEADQAESLAKEGKVELLDARTAIDPQDVERRLAELEKSKSKPTVKRDSKD